MVNDYELYCYEINHDTLKRSKIIINLTYN